MDLKERFEHYEATPDPKVWKGINKRLRLRKALRYTAMTAAAAVVVVITVLAYRPQPRIENEEPSTQQSPVAKEEKLLVAEQHAMPNTSSATNQQDYHSQVPVAQNKVTQARISTAQKQNEETIIGDESHSVGTSLPTAHANQAKAEATSNSTSSSATATQPTAVKHGENIVATNNAYEQTAVPAKANKLSPITNKDSLQIWIPNAFSPDDPLNPAVQVFKVIPKSGANFNNFKMYIFNRGGGKVFHSTSSTVGWDGTYQGEKCPMGSYVYIIEYTDGQGKIQHTKGTVTLIR